ncbi:Helitron helicase [Phytophthora megakarya]|uniref:ATP-dependent DNA helicase n=1 Tax=Phytophthora megakarya TaxID=4795 RepID=A0A225VJD8_9STRA|nr:Helitron helicase [Phytophthora megakarya]
MQKLKTLNQDLDEGVLGVVAAKVHVVEYQKRGLPHVHILLILRSEDKPVSAEDVDRLVSAELPDKEKHPELYETVISNMLHGPCGQQNPNCPCMKNGKCSKKFPKVFADETVMADDKYPTYMRRPRPEGTLNHKGKMWDNATINKWINLIRRGDRTKLTAFFNLCARDPEGTENLLYKDVPKKYRWDDRTKRWKLYKTYVASLGQLVHVSPQDPERFYLRILLCHRRSPKLFEDIRTVNGVVHETFHDAALGCWDDREWEECLAEAVSFKMPYALRQRFGTILVYSLPDHASALWDRFKKDFSEDYYKSIAERDRQNNIERHEEVRLRMAEYKRLKWVAEFCYGMERRWTYMAFLSSEVEREGTGPRDVVANEIAAYEPEDLARTTALADQMNENQKEVFDQVIEAVNHPVDGQKLFFVDGPGGTGKSFLLEQMLAHVRLQKKVTIAVASSGIAATLLTGGHTAHSTFRIPMKLSEFSTCSLPWQS